MTKVSCSKSIQCYYIYSDLYAENDDDDNVDVQDDYEVIEIAPNRFKTTLHVPQ